MAIRRVPEVFTAGLLVCQVGLVVAGAQGCATRPRTAAEVLARSVAADGGTGWPQDSGESALQQLQVQMARPLPYDLDETNLTEYRRLHPKWHDWRRVSELCATIAGEMFRRL